MTAYVICHYKIVPDILEGSLCKQLLLSLRVDALIVILRPI